MPVDSLRDARVLVTGSTGFIGLNLCRALSREGAHVVGACVTQGRQKPDYLDSLETVQLSDENACDALIKNVRPDIIYHMGALVTGARDIDLVKPMIVENLIGTVNVIHSVHANSVGKIVVAGSIEEPKDHEMVSSPYAASKFAARMYGELYRSLSEINLTHACISMVYGPMQRDMTKLVPYVISQLLQGVGPQLTSGTRLADWIYVDDVVDALLLLAKNDRHPAKVDIGTGELNSVRMVVEILASYADPNIELSFGGVMDRPNEVANAADVSVLESSYQFSPQYSLKTGLEKTFDWYRGHLQGSVKQMKA